MGRKRRSAGDLEDDDADVYPIYIFDYGIGRWPDVLIQSLQKKYEVGFA